MSDKLLPCPFCGTEPVLMQEEDYVSVACPHYHCNFSQIALRSSEKAIERWNTRNGVAPTSWRHIETAPRDGTPFLCFHPDDVFSPQTGIDLIWYEPSIKTYTQDGDNEVPFAGITHWMPLPSPPQKGER